MESTKPSREELFILIWERPTTEVAKELGISDVALGKLCRLYVVKPSWTDSVQAYAQHTHEGLKGIFNSSFSLWVKYDQLSDRYPAP